MTRSMTGFASQRGAWGTYSWSWDIRSVNGRGLDLRLRLPDWIGGLEQEVRGALQKEIARGNVQMNLRVTRDAGGDSGDLDEAALERVVKLMQRIEQKAVASGLMLSPMNAGGLATLPGVLAAAADEEETNELKKALMGELPKLIDAFNDARNSEGEALNDVMSQQVDQIEALTKAAADCAETRAEAQKARLVENLNKVLEASTGVDEGRLAQELALLAVKADVTEEIDRLGAHVTAARELVARRGAKGRKLDFLMQEFNREANTLCSKAGSTELTTIGLDLKAVIDQMREQVQNVE